MAGDETTDPEGTEPETLPEEDLDIVAGGSAPGQSSVGEAV